MKRIILKIYKTPKLWKEKYNLECAYRYVYYDYQNKILTSAGIPNFLDKSEFISDLLKHNKHRFTKRTLPLF